LSFVKESTKVLKKILFFVYKKLFGFTYISLFAFFKYSFANDYPEIASLD